MIAVYVCCQTLYDRSRLEAKGVNAQATVQWASATGGRSNNNYTIRVGYRDRSGRDWSRDFTVMSSQYRAGQMVSVRYLPADPLISMLGENESGVTRMQELVGLIVGSIAVLIGGTMAFAIYRPTKEKAIE